MKDSWCAPIYYHGKQLSGGAARNVLISRSGGMDAIITKVATQVYNEAMFAANTADGGKIIQMPKRTKTATA